MHPRGYRTADFGGKVCRAGERNNAKPHGLRAVKSGGYVIPHVRSDESTVLALIE